jgi:competence protein ComEC
MHKSQRFFIIATVCICGVLLASQLTYVTISIACAICILFLIHYRLSLLFFVVCGVFLLSGYGYYNLHIEKITQNHIAYYQDEKITFTGVIRREPDRRIDHTKYVVDVDYIDDKDHHGEILIKHERFPVYNYGDRVRVTCKIRIPGEFNGFDYGAYLARYDIYATCYHAQIYRESTGHGNILASYVYQLKDHILYITNKVVHEPQASFLAGILLGSRKGIDPQLIDAFNRTGTTHIIAVSGYNITLLSTGILSLCIALCIPRKKSFWLSVVIICVFTIMTGASAAVVRSALMGVIVLYARYSGRRSHTHILIVCAALIMIIYNPKIAYFDIGFQLSFTSTLGLIYATKYTDFYFKYVPEVLGLQEALSTTFSSLVFTLPLLVIYFSSLSLSAPVVNMLILPMIPLSMAYGAIAVLVGFVSPVMGAYVGTFVWLFLLYVIKIVELFSSLPLSYVTFEKSSIYLILIVYSICIYVFYTYAQNQLKKESSTDTINNIKS